MRNIWKTGIAGLMVLALAGTAAGIVAAQTGGSTPGATEDQATDTPLDKDTRRDAYLDALAANLGVTREALDQALTDTALEMVDKALADGKINEDEAANIKERISSGDFPPIGPGFGHGFEKGFHRGFHVGVNLEDLATFLGVDVSAIREGLMNEQSLAQIAEANGKTRDELKAHLTSNVEEKLAELVADGSLTQAEADEKLQNFADHLDEMVDNTGPRFRGGPGHPGGPRFHHDGPGHFEGLIGEDVPAPTGNTTQTSSLTL